MNNKPECIHNACEILFITLFVLFFTILTSINLYAGPPCVTDDPEQVEYRHWEFYIASQFNYAKGAISGTAPLAEINFGVIPDVQLHVIAPAAYSITRG